MNVRDLREKLHTNDAFREALQSKEYREDVNVLPLFFSYMKFVQTNMGKNVYRWLDKDKLSAIILCGETYWFEYNSSLYQSMPKYVHSYIKKLFGKYGKVWLWDKNFNHWPEGKNNEKK